MYAFIKMNIYDIYLSIIKTDNILTHFEALPGVYTKEILFQNSFYRNLFLEVRQYEMFPRLLL